MFASLIHKSLRSFWRLNLALALVLALGTMSLVLTWGSVAWAQNPGDGPDVTGQNVGYEAGFHLGKLLPNQIEGVSEIVTLGGAYGGFRVGPGQFANFGMIVGNGGGAEWKNLSASLRMDMPIETLVGIVFFGLDATNFEGATGGNQTVFGGHAGGGVMALLGGSTWFRTDMKFAFSPGTSLYISFGILFRMPGGAGSGSE